MKTIQTRQSEQGRVGESTVLKLLEGIIPLITALGIGGLVGAFFQSRFERQKHLEQQEHELKRKRYLCTLILMLTKLDPRTGLPRVHDFRPDLRDLDDIEKEIRTELLNAVLFASDEVIKALAEFVRKPDYPSYIKAAASMRRDLWNKKTAIDETALQVLSEGMVLQDEGRHSSSAL